MTQLKEADLQKQVMGYLALTDLQWWRVPLGGVMKAGGKVLARNPMAGFPDLIGLIPPAGKLWGMELKSTRGVISPIQKATIQRLVDGGAIVEICRDFAQAKKFIDFLKSF